jgi:cell division protein FtsB
MTGPVVQSHGHDGTLVDDKLLASLEIQYDQCFGKENWRMPAQQQERMESLAKASLMLVREIRSLRKQVDAKKGE